MVYEMRFQTVDPAKRADYVKTYREAVQGCKSAGSTGGHILCSEDDPSAVIVILLWESKEHLARWRGTESYKSFRAAVEGLQTKKSHGGFYLARRFDEIASAVPRRQSVPNSDLGHEFIAV